MAKLSFQPIFFNWYLSNEKPAFVDKSRVEPTIFFIEKILFSLNFFSGHFYGQSFIKTFVVLLSILRDTNSLAYTDHKNLNEGYGSLTYLLG